MKRPTAIAVCLLGVAGIYWFAQAGDMEPPGPPAPTMVTLQEIYDACTAGGGGPCGVPKTGQKSCWDASGNPISCTGTGQDGEYEAGVSVGPRFTDNGDGTVTDNLTGLIWLQHASCFGARNWTNALADANGLADGSCGLSDGSAAGDWRLPNVRELHSLIDFGRLWPALPGGHPFSSVQSVSYWSSTTNADIPSHAWYVYLSEGHVSDLGKTFTNHVWPVRGGL